MTEDDALSPGRRARMYSRAFAGFLARDLRVLSREFVPFLLRTVMNPILFVFVFAYLFPKIGDGIRLGDTDLNFATILVPGLVAVGMIFQGVAAVALPLVHELGRTHEIEDRLLAPLPVELVAVEKLVFGALQSLLAALVVFPVVYTIPAMPVSVHVTSWPTLFAVLLLAALISGAFGLVIGTLFKPQQVPLIFSIIVLPVTFLGCVYYPWAMLEPLPWLQLLVLVNPVVYMSEGLRAVLTPDVPHMPREAFLGAMLLMLAALTLLGLRTFLRRVSS